MSRGAQFTWFALTLVAAFGCAYGTVALGFGPCGPSSVLGAVLMLAAPALLVAAVVMFIRFALGAARRKEAPIVRAGDSE